MRNNFKCSSGLTITQIRKSKCDRGAGTDVVLRNYTYDALGRPLTRTTSRNGTTQNDTFGYDLTKNVCEVFGPAGYIRTSYSYAPFGNVTESGDVTQPFQWSSEVYDSELDLVYYNFRHYSPSLGRFLSRDPIAEQGGLNLYAFVKNNPLMRIDVKGRDFCSFLKSAKSEALERLDEKIQKLGEKLPKKIEEEIKRNIDREYRKFAKKYGSPLENYSSLTLFPTINSTSPIQGGLSISFSANLTSPALLNLNGRDYAIEGRLEYTIDYERENLESSLKITKDIGMCGISVGIDYQLNKNWSFRLSLEHEHSYEKGFSESGKESVNFNFKYIK